MAIEILSVGRATRKEDYLQHVRGTLVNISVKNNSNARDLLEAVKEYAEKDGREWLKKDAADLVEMNNREFPPETLEEIIDNTRGTDPVYVSISIQED